jgi:hypothetical protein
MSPGFGMRVVSVFLLFKVIASCDSSSSPGASDAGFESGAFDSGTAPPFVDDDDAAPPTGPCKNGNPRPPAAVLQALQQLLGAWQIMPSDDPDMGKRTLTFSAKAGPAAVGDTDLGCIYADQGFIDLTYDQKDLGMANNCIHDAYHLRLENNGAPGTGGYIYGYRQGLKPDGTDNGQPEIESFWMIAPGSLDWDNQHFGGGAGFSCPP